MSESASGASLDRPQGVTARAVKGGIWLYGRQLVVGLINVGVFAILARKLSPADFGLVALAQVVLRFTVVLSSGGVGDYVIYDRDEGREDRVRAAFWLNLALALAVACVGILVAPFAASFFAMPGLQSVLLVLLATYVLDQAAVVPEALLERAMVFPKLVIRDTFLRVASALLSVTLALEGFGVWSLVVPAFVLSPVRLALVMVMARWFPGLALHLGEWRRILRYAGSVIGAQLANTVAAEGDTVIVGKALGGEALGFYNMAWQAANLVCRQVSGVVSALAMPSLSAVAADPKRLQDALSKMLRWLGLTTFPLLVGLFVVADDFVVALYGPRWEASVLPLRILILYAMRRAVGSPASVIFNVVGRPDVALKYALGFIPFYLGSVLYGSRYGIIGVAVSVTIVRTLGGLVQFWLSAWVLKTSLGRLLSGLWQPLLASLLMGGLVALTARLLDFFPLAAAVRLLLEIAAGGLFYVLVIALLCRSLVKDVVTIADQTVRPLGVLVRRVTRYA